MYSALVLVTEDHPTERLIEAAKQHVKGVDVDLYVCRIYDRIDYQGKLRQGAISGKEVESIEELEQQAKEVAESIGTELVDENNGYTAIGRVGEIPRDAFEIAENNDIDHIFVPGKNRSPTGKAVFGDGTQDIILRFDGPVTVVTGDQ